MSTERDGSTKDIAADIRRAVQIIEESACLPRGELFCMVHPSDFDHALANNWIDSDGNWIADDPPWAKKMGMILLSRQNFLKEPPQRLDPG